MKEHVFIFRNNCEVVKLLNVFHHKVFSVSFVIVEKKATVMKAFPFILDTTA